MQKAWRERNPQARIRAAYQAIEMNQEWVLLSPVFTEKICIYKHHIVVCCNGNTQRKSLWLSLLQLRAHTNEYFSFIMPLSYSFFMRNIISACRCAAAYVLLAEEEATTITEAERLFKKALTIGKNGFEFTSSAPNDWTMRHNSCHSSWRTTTPNVLTQSMLPFCTGWKL